MWDREKVWTGNVTFLVLVGRSLFLLLPINVGEAAARDLGCLGMTSLDI